MTNADTADPRSPGAPVTIRRLGPDEWRDYREVRMAALRDTPTAFGSTLAQSTASEEDDWRRRLAGGVMFAATVPGLAAELPGGAEVPGDVGLPGGVVGIAGGYVETYGSGADGQERVPELVHLVSMWVHPHARGKGVGAVLVDTVVAWATAEGARELHLWVTEGNEPAERLYQRCGFEFTAERAPLPSDPRLSERGMVRALA